MIVAERKRWHAETVEEAAAFWESDLARGITDEAAARRLAELGDNSLVEAPPPSLVQRLLAQLSEAPVLILLVMALLAGLIGVFAKPGETLLARYGDAIAILLIVILNAWLGLSQERRAERSLAALRRMTAPTARVVRGGAVREMAAQMLVPGDLVLLEEGDKIPADLLLVSTAELDVVEGALTGESFPVAKDASAKLPEDTPLAERVNMAFMGTHVSRGRARALVVNTGMHTEIGQIAGLLAQMEMSETPLQQSLHRFGKAIVVVCLLVSAIVFFAGMVQGTQTWVELLMVTATLAVAAIPEGLPAITTIVLALGTERMARRHAVVRRLPAVEGLGCAQIICTDKTGTLTQNVMAVRRLHVDGKDREIGDDAFELSAPAERAALRVAAHATGARLAREDGQLRAVGDPTDAAMRLMAARAGIEVGEPEIVREAPFTSARRMASVVVREKGREIGLVRGAPEVLLNRSTALWDGAGPRPMTVEDRDRLMRVAADWGRDAMRVIGLALAPTGDDPERDLAFVGLVGIVDPPRPEVASAIRDARDAGIHTMMVTGDHPATALAIAREIGLWQEGDLALSGPVLDGIDQQNLEEMVPRVRVVARATAAHKLRIVDALKARGFVCAMTGDGVNDAPAVKAASIGVAMGRAGTEVTKEAADLVIADDNYATIVVAVEQGRAIYANIRKFIFFLLSSNTSIVIVVFLAGLLGWEQPLAPIQILWINLITNGLPALALGVEPPEPGLMRLPPRDPRAPLMGGREYVLMVLTGVVMSGATLWAFKSTLEAGYPLDLARTCAFTILSLSPMFHAFNCRSSLISNFRLGWGTNRALILAVLIGLLLQLVAVYVPPLHPVFKTAPLGGRHVVWLLSLSAIPLVLGELWKLARSASRGDAGPPAPVTGPSPAVSA
ncbi:MAG: cation-translocating P-type ATPase [Myxococcota bacterium]